MLTGSGAVTIVEGTGLISAEVGTTNDAPHAQNCVSGALQASIWPYYQGYSSGPAVLVTDVSIRFVENGVLVSFKGKEYIFKDILAAANHITKLRG